MSSITTTVRASDRLLNVLADYPRVVVVMHDNPDPDAIATGWAIYALIEERLQKPVRLLGGGGIVRAENRHLVELLSPPLELVDQLRVNGETAVVLVDCTVGTTNHLATRAGVHPVAVIDHHLGNERPADLRFLDSRAEAAASASIAASHLREQHVDPGVKLATAILYAIRTDRSGSDAHHSRLDREMVKWLTDLADPALLAEIENAPLPREYFGDLTLALLRAFVYDDSAICFLPRASGAEIVGEVADLLVRCRSIQRVLCAAFVGDDLMLSSRTKETGGNAAELLSSTLRGLGGCGGHEHRAGGKIPAVAQSEGSREELYDLLRRHWLEACGVDRQRGTRLVARRSVEEHL
jgi:nanoRNase/pAp phosphatase (c-di-AMP/oligoRNAs hydrolase)